MRIRTGLLACIFVVILAGGCGAGGGSQVQRNQDEMAKRVTKLEEELHTARRQLEAQKQALQILSERMRDAEARVDKLAYGSSIRR